MGADATDSIGFKRAPISFDFVSKDSRVQVSDKLRLPWPPDGPAPVAEDAARRE